MLLTDGLPNCDKDNPNHICVDTSPARRQACACTLQSCDDALILCALGCLDDSASVAAVQSLRQSGITTLVIGFGADTNTPDARRVLDALATAGGHPLFHASNSAELTRVLDEVLHSIPGDPCLIALDGTWQNPLASLSADGVFLPAGPDTWSLSGSSVTLEGALCNRARAATPGAPLNIEVRVVERL